MDVQLHRAAPGELPVLANLFQYYIYDFSEFVDVDVQSDGRFEGRSLASYWEDTWRHPFIVRVGDKLAGFALVHQRSRITGDITTWDVAEFFVLRRYRRSGVGRAAATLVFDAFHGPWEVRQRIENSAATAFWRDVIARYTGGRFEERLIDDERWRGPVQSFRNDGGHPQPERAGGLLS